VLGPVGSVLGSVGSVLGSVGSVLGPVGSVLGSVGSVLGSVGLVVDSEEPVVGGTGEVVDGWKEGSVETVVWSVEPVIGSVGVVVEPVGCGSVVLVSVGFVPWAPDGSVGWLLLKMPLPENAQTAKTTREAIKIAIATTDMIFRKGIMVALTHSPSGAAFTLFCKPADIFLPQIGQIIKSGLYSLPQ